MPAAASQPYDVSAAINRADRLLQLGRLAEAGGAIAALQAQAPKRAEPWLLGARLAQIEGDFAAMLAAADYAARVAPQSVTAGMIWVEAQIMCGETAAARARLAALEQIHGANAGVLRRLSETYTHLGQHADADHCMGAARALRPDDLDGQFQAASCALAMGRLDEAEGLLDSVIARRPDDFDAAYNRATLRTQTTARNHIAELRASLARVGADRAPPALFYALGKELEDLGDPAAFDAIANGARARRAALQYDVGADITAMSDIEGAFGASFFSKHEAGYQGEAPIFVVGLPRSGTTLVDRILSGHPDVESRGELNDLALAVMRAAGKCADKRERIGRTATADMAALGEGYCRAVRGAGAAGKVFLDKTPLNFLYLGVIARALPQAKIIHLTRRPMASGYAMLKTLFRMGYPFSYDQTDIGRYMGAYARLMRHWREFMGERILDVAYEDIVADIETQSRRMLAFCGLDWRVECVAFHENRTPSTTASAAQVRKPLYASSVEQWRAYEAGLTPLAHTLKGEGLI